MHTYSCPVAPKYVYTCSDSAEMTESTAAWHTAEIGSTVSLLMYQVLEHSISAGLTEQYASLDNMHRGFDRAIPLSCYEHCTIDFLIACQQSPAVTKNNIFRFHIILQFKFSLRCRAASLAGISDSQRSLSVNLLVKEKKSEGRDDGDGCAPFPQRDLHKSYV